MIGTKHENDKNTFSGQQKRVQAVEGIVNSSKMCLDLLEILLTMFTFYQINIATKFLLKGIFKSKLMAV